MEIFFRWPLYWVNLILNNCFRILRFYFLNIDSSTMRKQQEWQLCLRIIGNRDIIFFFYFDPLHQINELNFFPMKLTAEFLATKFNQLFLSFKNFDPTSFAALARKHL